MVARDSEPTFEARRLPFRWPSLDVEAAGIHPLEITQQPPAQFSEIGFGPAASSPAVHAIELTLIEAKQVEVPLTEARQQTVHVAARGAVEAWLDSPPQTIFEAQSDAEVLPTLGAPVSGFAPSMPVPVSPCMMTGGSVTPIAAAAPAPVVELPIPTATELTPEFAGYTQQLPLGSAPGLPLADWSTEPLPVAFLRPDFAVPESSVAPLPLPPTANTSFSSAALRFISGRNTKRSLLTPPYCTICSLH